jgi:hypothetical protein
MMRPFEHWGDFYLLVGTAAAALLALLFVAVSVGIGYLTDKRAAATRTFFSPIIVHFAVVLFLSAVALAPLEEPAIFAAAIGGCGLVGLAISTFTTVQLLRTDWTRFMVDRLGYGLLPAVAYVALLGAAILIVRGSALAAEVLAGALLLLLMVNIRNAWDLMLSMVRRHGNDG